jgi:photosystem II stability/assembly factor-like uncharacterized protein
LNVYSRFFKRNGRKSMNRAMACLTMMAMLCVTGVLHAAPPGRTLEKDEHGAVPLERSATIESGRHVDGESDGAPSWSALGPFGGDVHDVAVSTVNPNILLAGIAPAGSIGGAMFRSTDGGNTWNVVNSLANTSVYDIEFAPDGTVYAATIDSVRKSIDGGASFITLNLGIGLNDQVFDIAIDPNNPLVIWAGIADALGSQPVNVMQSVNGGTSWMNRTPPIGSALSGRAIGINPLNSQEIYAGFAGGQLWVSTNGGTSWINRSAGLPTRPINDITHDGNRVLVCGGQLFGSQTFGLYQSTNMGMTWIAMHDGSWPNLMINDVTFDPGNPSTVYVVSATSGVYRSPNGGPWEFGVGGTGSMSLNSLRFGTSSAHILVGANSVAVLQSQDAGNTFTITSHGISKLNVVAIASNPNDINELAIAFEGANDGGVYRSTDGGQTWALQSCPPTRYSNVAFKSDGTLYAISSGPSSIAPEGLYRRNANGTWTGLGPDQGGLFESDLLAIQFGTSTPGFILLGGSDFGVAGFEPTIWRTSTGGAPWTKVYEGPQANEFVNAIQIVSDTRDAEMIAAVVDFSGSSGGGVLRSTLGGGLGSWLPSSAGLPTLVQANALSPSPEDPHIFFLADRQGGANGGLYKSVNGGQTWTSTGFASQVFDVVCDPADPQIVYIMQNNATAVWQSANGGASFSPFNTGLSFNGFVNDLAYAPGATPRLLLSTSVGSFATDLPGPANPADINNDGVVNVIDLLAVINAWGACPGSCQPSCPADIAPHPGGDCSVNVQDLLMVIANWG